MVNPGSRDRNYTALEAPSRHVELTIPLGLAGVRLDLALAKLLPEVSRSRLARLIEDGQVRVDGGAATGRRRVKSGERVEVALQPRPQDASFRAEPIDIQVIHEDAHVLVLDKPAGLVVHPGAGNWSGTLMNAILHHAPEAKHLPRAGIVHRLDKQTSGLLVVARTEAAQLDLVRQLQERSVKRTYVALARGRVSASGTIDKPIGRHPVRRTRMAVVAKGKPAITHYRVRERFAAHTLLECDLETGRTHQIRVHLAAIGHPLEGDAEYGASASAPRRFGRQALHAWKLAFRHPASGKTVQFESPLPADFAQLLEELRGT